MHFIKKLFWLFPILATTLLISGCSGNSDAKTEVANGHLPEYVAEAPPRVREAYDFAVSHPDDLKNYPCYCGCGGMGHTSNLSCYVKEIKDSGDVIYDSHAAGCGICVDITQDVIRLMDEGKTPLQIRQYVDALYSAYGPSTDTPMPAE